MIDEDPSDEDLDRFSAETGYCPDCGREVWDEAWECPHCGEVIEGRVSRDRQGAVGRSLSARSVVVLVAMIVVILVLIQLR